MKMSKTLRKLNDKLIATIDSIQQQANEQLEGFSSLSHTVKFDLFPGSLLVSCYFESHDHLDKAKKHEKTFQKLLHKMLLKQGILLKDSSQNLKFYVQDK